MAMEIFFAKTVRGIQTVEDIFNEVIRENVPIKIKTLTKNKSH